MKIKTYKKKACAIMEEPSFPSGMITVKCYNQEGNIIDKTRCDTKREANEYFKTFCKLAKNS